MGLTSNGEALTYSLNATGDVLTASAGGRLIFTVELFDLDTGSFKLNKLGGEADKLRLGHYDGILLPFNVTVEEGRRLQEMNFGAYLLGLRLLLRDLLDIPSRLRRKRDNRVTLGPALVAQLRCSMLDRDIPLWLNSPIQKLLVSNGRVRGAIVERDGQGFRYLNAHNLQTS